MPWDLGSSRDAARTASANQGVFVACTAWVDIGTAELDPAACSTSGGLRRHLGSIQGW